MRIRAGLPSLRRSGPFEVLRRRFLAGCDRFGFRLIEFSIQSNHLHLIAEAGNARSLTRGMQGLAVRIARGLNRLWDRTGKVFADRYHDRILRTPREVRNALRYVLNNGRRHLVHFHRWRPDDYSSGAWFDGWKDYTDDGRLGIGPIARARTWLLGKGWRRHGLLPLLEAPRPD